MKLGALLSTLVLLALLGLAGLYGLDQPASAQTVISSIKLRGGGHSPAAIAVNPAINRIYVANYSSDSVSVIDGASNTVAATVPVGSRPRAVGVNPTTNRIYVANWYSDTVYVIEDVGPAADTTPPAVVGDLRTVDITSSGFVYPAGKSGPYTYAGWLAGGAVRRQTL